MEFGISVIDVIFNSFIDANYNLNRAIIYYLIITILALLSLKKAKKVNSDKWYYTLNLLIFVSIMTLFTGEITMICTIIYTLLIVFFYILINKISKKDKEKARSLPIASYIAISNIITIILIGISQYFYYK